MSENTHTLEYVLLALGIGVALYVIYSLMFKKRGSTDIEDYNYNPTFNGDVDQTDNEAVIVSDFEETTVKPETSVEQSQNR